MKRFENFIARLVKEGFILQMNWMLKDDQVQAEHYVIKHADLEGWVPVVFLIHLKGFTVYIQDQTNDIADSINKIYKAIEQ